MAHLSARAKRKPKSDLSRANQERIARAQACIIRYQCGAPGSQRISDTDLEAVSDLLTDLMHWSAANMTQADFERCLRMARGNFWAERGERD